MVSFIFLMGWSFFFINEKKSVLFWLLLLLSCLKRFHFEILEKVIFVISTLK